MPQALFCSSALRARPPIFPYSSSGWIFSARALPMSVCCGSLCRNTAVFLCPACLRGFAFPALVMPIRREYHLFALQSFSRVSAACRPSPYKGVIPYHLLLCNRFRVSQQHASLRHTRGVMPVRRGHQYYSIPGNKLQNSPKTAAPTASFLNMGEFSAF